MELITKSDELDALAVAKTLIFEFKHLPFADPQDVYLAIKQTLNTRNNYVQMTANIKMSLQNILVHHYPMHKEFFKDLESKTQKVSSRNIHHQTYLKWSQSGS